jgi:hypothetical protein
MVERSTHLDHLFRALGDPTRRAKAFEMNSNGWAAQMENIKRHLGA